LNTKSGAGGLRAELDDLWVLLSAGKASPVALARLAPPQRLRLLFHLALGDALRRGPAAGGDVPVGPAALVAAAVAAAEKGVFPLAGLITMRRLLEKLAEELLAMGAWGNESPLWWGALPAPSALERWWQICAGYPGESEGPESYPLKGPPGYHHFPTFLEPKLLTAISHDLVKAGRAGILPLVRAGVGAEGKTSDRRSDSVCYLCGRESWLLEKVPGLAALIQWGLHSLVDRLQPLASLTCLFPPETAMLARYRAPSGGYAAHRDNPGGSHDNGRTLTLTLYLNEPEHPVVGGALALWRPDDAISTDPHAVLPAIPGSAVIFDSRRCTHQVMPVAAGPERWALSFWFHDVPRSPEEPPLPWLTATDVLMPLTSPPLAPDRLLVHDVEQRRISAWSVSRRRPRLGLVTTVYGAGEGLKSWCEHHVTMGFDHLVLVFDRLEEPAETRLARELAAAFDNLTTWSGPELAATGWASLETADRPPDLVAWAHAGGTSQAVAARQMLNAGVVLQAARGEGFGGAPLDWLLHLDADETFWLEGAARGGGDLHEHFAAAESAGPALLRYLNHEVLVEAGMGDRPGDGRYKLNPHLARARLGDHGWSALVAHLKMSQTDRRPWFNGYYNGKAAVAVARARAAAGVHGWRLTEGSEPPPLLAGPCILHAHNRSPAAFAAKYLRKAATPVPEGVPPFQPSQTEVAALDMIRRLQARKAPEEIMEQRLQALHRELTHFTPAEIDLLEEAGLLLRPGQTRKRE